MKIAGLQEKGNQAKCHSHLIIVDREEAALILAAVEAYSVANPRKKTIKKVFKELEDNLFIF